MTPNQKSWTVGQLGEFTDLSGNVRQCKITKLLGDSEYKEFQELIEVSYVKDGVVIKGACIHRDEFTAA